LGAILDFKRFNTGVLVHMLGEVISHLACAEEITCLVQSQDNVPKTED